MRQSGFDADFAVFDRRPVRLHRNHAGRIDHLAGFDIERSVVEIAFHDVAVDIALVQQAGTVRSKIVGDVILAIEIEHSQLKSILLDADGFAFCNFVNATEF
jgi:hypothetical protein